MSRRVLLVCYYFPPLGLAGVRRPLALYKKLTDYGYEPSVLTVKPVTYFVYEPHLLEGLDLTRLHRSGSSDPQRLMWLLGKRNITPAVTRPASMLSSKVFPDSKKGWVRPALNLGRTLCNNYRYEAIISSSPPVSAHMIAMKLSREYKIPWVADFRDFWTMKTIEESYDSPGLIARGNKLLTQIIAQASEVTGVSQAITDYLAGGEVIQNGFDLERSRGWRKSSRANQFVLALPGNQVASSKLKPLWQLLARLKSTSPELMPRLTILQVGLGDPRAIADQLKAVAPDVEFEGAGYLHADEYIDRLSEASAFYLGLDDNIAATVVPSRSFELLASGRPLFAYCDSAGVLARLLARHSAGVAFNENSVSDAAESLSRLIRTHLETGSVFRPLPEFVNEYSTDKMAEQFAKILGRII